MSKKKVIILIIVLVILAGLVYFFYPKQRKLSQTQEVTITTGKMRKEVKETSVIVDRLSKKVEFDLFWSDERYKKDDFEFSLRSPSGRLINENTNDPKIEIISTGLALAKGFRITSPESGVWQIIVKYPKQTEFNTDYIIWSDLKFDWDFLNPTPKVNEPIIIQAKILEPEPVTGAEVLATLKKYKKGSINYTRFNFRLKDDGKGSDEKANDGIYTAIFSNTNEEGNYCLEIKARGSTQKAGEFERKFEKCTFVSR